ncbi:MAG: bifunctional UDP-N-acetylglucosamine diphosphorylase/glucosamine-1-phosphate N-acetyltransferase GlmU [Selenomonadaceae bacterium]|nr:bifunctional UDP-N-acetylglucosamine diphosphorylase/glucosamine-1-phosphate N-acetyltransferase GlmU [Selenomonadaceae bacterium]MBQ7723081.1 bifunctional UDP-N-acetylglucosamine diphosphorylase/glucosamine-1-phosphate N-acetyltransferase GlmU [Selenomonadaceae bacterium]
MRLETLILAAGKGTRMKSKLPKVLHRVGGKTMLQHVIDAAKKAGSEREVVVIGSGAKLVEESISGVEFVMQEEQLGTGHAVLSAKKNFEQSEGTVLILCGDTPLLTAKLLKDFTAFHEESKCVATVLTAKMPDATGYGRIIRESDGSLEKIVEEKDANELEKKILEVNAGVYCFDVKKLFSALEKVGNDNSQGEYYLPDVLTILKSAGEKIGAFTAQYADETLGINSRVQLAAADKVFRMKKNHELLDAGVTIIDPNTTFIDYDVQIGQDTIIYPNTYIEGNTVIGEDCAIGPDVRFTNMKVGNRVTAQFSYCHEAEICDGVTLGPYVHLRPGTTIGENVKIGNFVEVKNSTIGEGSKLPHLQYIGDTDMGSGVNVGCGSVTCNYDGKQKFRTKIGDNVFIGCNTNLVAPVNVEDGAYIAAGSTITKDVPKDSLAIGRARQTNIEVWNDKRKV